MKPIELQQKKAIYAMGGSLGLVDKINRNDDNLHQMVEGMTGKEHISELSYAEAQEVIGILKERMRGQYKSADKSSSSSGLTEGQRKKIWALMYQLADCDTQPSSAGLGDRLCGIVRRELHIDAAPNQPLRWLTYQQGSRLIEKLKGYVSTAAQHKSRGDANGQAAEAAGTG